MNYGKSGVECDADIVPGWFPFRGEAGTQMATTCPPHWSCNSGEKGWMKGELPQWQVEGSPGWPVSTLVMGAVCSFLYYNRRNFCNLIGLEQWYSSLI